MTVIDIATAKLRRRGSLPYVQSTESSRYPESWERSGDLYRPRYAVTPRQALTVPTFLACVRLIASSIAALPVVVKRTTPGQRVPVLDRSQASVAFRGRPNSEQTTMRLYEQLFFDEVIQDAFLFCDKAEDGSDQIANVHHISRLRMEVGRSRSTGRKVYVMDGEHAMLDYSEGGEIIHIPGFGPGLRGTNIVDVAEQAIGLGISAQDFAARSLVEGGIPPGIISVEGILSDDDADKVEARWSRQRRGAANRLRVAVLSNNAKFVQLSQDAEKLQLMALRRYQAGEMCTLTGVPPFMVGLVDSSTSWGSGLAEQVAGFARFSLSSHAARVEQAVSQFGLVQDLTGRYMEFDMDAFLSATKMERYQTYALGWGRWLSPNMILVAEGMEPVEGGDEILVGVNLVPLDQMAELVKAQREKGGSRALPETSPSTPGQPERQPAK